MTADRQKEILDRVPAASAIAGPASPILAWAAPIDRWDEAVPLGNGRMGGLLWGSGQALHLSLDRGDLWDLRVPESLAHLRGSTWSRLKELVAEGNQARISELVDAPFVNVPYTMDRRFLVERAIPYCSAIAASLAQREERGVKEWCGDSFAWMAAFPRAAA